VLQKRGNRFETSRQFMRSYDHGLSTFFRTLLTVFTANLGIFGLATGSSGNTPGEPPGTVLFLGDSLTAGYGLDPETAYPALVQEMIEAAGLPFKAINAGVSGDTTAGGGRRLKWSLRRPVDVLVLALGANDGLRGFNLEATRGNLRRIVIDVREAYPTAVIILAGMKVPPNMGPEYSREFESIFTDLAASGNLTLIPFLLEGVATIPELNQSDGIHPNPAGHKVVAKTVWGFLRPVLEARSANQNRVPQP
jgi:acyl-CoA thioesterase-1